MGGLSFLPWVFLIVKKGEQECLRMSWVSANLKMLEDPCLIFKTLYMSSRI